MSDYKNTALSHLYCFRSIGKFAYEDFKNIDEAIAFFEQADEDTKYADLVLRLRIKAAENHFFDLIFMDSDFQFSEYIYDGEDSYYPIDCRIDYEGNPKDGNDGLVDDWEEKVNSLLTNYDPNSTDNEVILYCDSDF